MPSAAALVLVAWCAAGLCAVCAETAMSAAPAPASPIDEWLNGLRVTTAPSGRVVVIGRTPMENLQVSQWAEDVVERTVSLTGLPCPFDRNRPLTVELNADPVAAPPSVPPAAVLFENGRRLRVRDMPRLPSDEAHAALCRCVLSAAMASQDRTAGLSAVQAGVPGWLVCGVARSLYAPRRAEDGEVVLDAWESGSLDTLAGFLDRMAVAGSEPPADPVDRARCAFVVAWLASRPARAEGFSRLLGMAARGGTAGGGELGQMLAVGFTPAGLEEEWDRRVLRQRRVVGQPGRVTPGGLRRFRAALLIYPGLSGMPLSQEPYRTMDWSSLLDRRDDVWMPGFCAQKSNVLRMAAVGRGEAVVRTAEAYCALLAAIREGRSGRRLKRLLAAATESEAGLAPAAAADGQGAEGTDAPRGAPSGKGTP